MNKGFVILAQNTEKVNYVECAEALALSIRNTMPDVSVSIITDDDVSSTLFDNVIKLPYGDLAPDSDWKLINDWQVYEASPYDYTIKLEADLYLPRSIDYWWEILSSRDVVVSSTIRNFHQDVSPVRAYRKFIDDNGLPDCYNAITYFKKGELAKNFFTMVKDIFVNWEEYKKLLKCLPEEKATTDWVYALAAHIIGKEKVLMPCFTDMSMIHMKQFINGQNTENWTDNFIYEIFSDVFRVQTIPQRYPFHYVVKNFSTKILENVECKTQIT